MVNLSDTEYKNPLKLYEQFCKEYFMSLFMDIRL